MALFGLFNKKQQTEKSGNIEAKSYYGPSSLVDFLRSNGCYNLAAYACNQYYSKVSAIGNAVGMVADGVAGLVPEVRDMRTGEKVQDHPVLQLLNKPNKENTYNEFMMGLTSYLGASGYSGLTVVGDVSREPLELSVTPSHYLNSPASTSLPDYLTVQAPDYNDQFNLSEERDLYRYYSEYRDRELYVVKDFNPQVSGASYFGMSKLTQLYPEIEQFIQSNNHNLSLLTRGGRPSGILSTDQKLDDTQFNRLKEMLNEYYAGAGNAGRMLLLENGKDFKELSQSNKDMDFAELKKDVRNSIYSQFKIPLALVNTDSMTMDNLKVSQLFLYDNAIMPVARKVFADLTRLLMYRYKGSENLYITFDKTQIEALAPRRWETIETINSLNIATDNEIRSQVGWEPYQGGDTHYVASNLIPVGEDAELLNSEKSLPTKDFYIKSLVATGKFTQEQAEAMAKRFDLNG